MLSINDRVAFNQKFLNSIDNDKEESDRRGTIVDVSEELFPKVRWDDEPEEIRSVHEGNLCRVINGVPVDRTA